MELTDESLQEFVRLWREEFGETLSLDEARTVAEQVLEFALLMVGDAGNYKL